MVEDHEGEDRHHAEEDVSTQAWCVPRINIYANSLRYIQHQEEDRHQGVGHQEDHRHASRIQLWDLGETWMAWGQESHRLAHHLDFRVVHEEARM